MYRRQTVNECQPVSLAAGTAVRYRCLTSPLERERGIPMADESPGLSPPYVSHRTLMTQLERMESEGIPSKIDSHFLRQMAGGTQNHFRHALRSLGLIGEDSRPTQVLYHLVEARGKARGQLFAKIMTDRFPSLYQLPPNASKSDFFTVLAEDYGVKSADQQRKILTFYVNTADDAGLDVSTHLRPTKSHPGPRRPSTRRNRRASSGAGTQPGDGPAAQNVPGGGEVLSDEAMRGMYFRLLLDKAQKADDDSELLDRIERLVGAATTKDSDQERRVAPPSTTTSVGTVEQDEP